VTGDATKPQISGTLSTQNGRLEVDQLLEQLTMNPYNTQGTVATEVPAPAVAEASQPSTSSSSLSSLSSGGGLYDAATVDIHVLLPDDLVLRGRDIQTAYSRMGLGNANITVGGDLNIRKAPGGEPEVVGVVTVVRGFYEFQGRRFEVLRDSQIRFTGLRPIDPSLQVGAQRLISGVTAIVNIRGTARQPAVTLTSSPPMDEADVLSLIVFNQPINQLGEGERLNLAQRAAAWRPGISLRRWPTLLRTRWTSTSSRSGRKVALMASRRSHWVSNSGHVCSFSSGRTSAPTTALSCRSSIGLPSFSAW
jgi:autotransporter translocation and assembly factor TamB